MCDVVYFRAGYTPADYPTNRQWRARTLLERSYSIKCPSVEHHLVGCKKVQQPLALPGELERFLNRFVFIIIFLWAITALHLSVLVEALVLRLVVLLALLSPTLDVGNIF